MSTRILAVAHEDKRTAHCPLHPDAILFEVAEGPHQGKRGCDACLFDLVGQLQWDRSEQVVFETGERQQRQTREKANK